MQTLELTALTPQQHAQYFEDGYLVIENLISTEEAAQLVEHYMTIAERPSIEGFDEPSDAPKIYPRLMFPHRHDAWSRRILLDRKIENVLSDVMGEEPVAAQTMMFYKPPGAKGQALHQDNFYLKVKPGTCVAVWIALDDTDEENGALQVVPGTGNAELECPHRPDAGEFFNNSEVYLPEGKTPVTVGMKAGDALVFGGSLIHGSTKNRSTNRWRRSLICHYCARSQTEQIAPLYQPLLTMDGEEIRYADAPEIDGPCGGEEGNSGY